MSRQRQAALEAVQRGHTTSPAVAEALGIDREHASVVLYNMVHLGMIEWTGETIPTGKGWALRVYQPKGHPDENPAGV